MPYLPANPDDLLKRGWVETTNPNNKTGNHRQFTHLETGMKVQFDQAKSGASGNAGKDHYHVTNPDFIKGSKIKIPEYLNKEGIPYNKGTEQSHILPGSTGCLEGF